MITLICGLQRAGKTTYSQKYEGICPIIHTDNYSCLERVMQRVKHADDVVVDGIFSTARMRKALLRSYHGETSRCIWLDTPLEVRQSRVRYIQYGKERFEPPTLDEGWDEIIIIKGDNDVERINRQTED